MSARRRQSRPRSNRRRPPPLPQSCRALFDTALEAHRDGNLGQAERIYRRLLELAPGHPEIEHLRAVALLESARPTEARAAVEAAIAAFAGSAAYHNTLGEAALALGQPQQARLAFQHAVELESGFTPAWNNLGLVAHRLGDGEGALAAFERAAALAPESAEARNNLGIALEATGQRSQAIESFRRAVELAPGHPQAWNNLGAALSEIGSLQEARQALGRAVEIAPSLARAHYNLARVHQEAGDMDDAADAIRAAIDADPRDPDFHVQRAYIERRKGDEAAARSALDAALALAPEHPLANNDRAVMLIIEGEFDAAERHLERALASAPDMAVAYENLARTRRFTDADRPLVERIEAALAAPGTRPRDRIHLHFAAGKVCDDLGLYERAFDHLAEGNRLVRATFSYDPDAYSNYVDRIIATVDASFLRRLEGHEVGDAGVAPIFIVGVPRSGTTLVEQILASHSKVSSAGEVDYFKRLTETLHERLEAPHDRYPQCLGRLSADDFQGIASAYRSSLGPALADHPCVTDKMPINFEHLGLIALVFPRARFVHCLRERRDTALSMFSTHFNAAMPYAYDLDEIARFQADCERLMDHWRAVLGSRITAVGYEDLTERPEPTIRGLLDALGLAFESACLAPHRTRRSVATASHWQVRQPLYRSSVGRWRHYARQLGAIPDS